MKIEKMRVNHVENPLGYRVENPGFSWIVTESAGHRAIAARVEIGLTPELKELVHDSGKREDIDSLGYYPEISLTPCTRYYWRVTVWDDAGDRGISPAAWFETAKMQEKWEAAWITPPFGKEIHPIFYKRFQVRGPIESARAYACGLGVFELYLNGRKAGDEVLAPFYTDYGNWLQYLTFDITRLLHEGENAAAAVLGNGWYKGRFGFIDGLDELYGDRFLLVCEIRITYRDGSTEVVGTDKTWSCGHSPVLESSIYDGEVYDAGLEQPDFALASCDIASWGPGVETAYDTPLIPRLSPALKVRERLPVRELIHTPAGEWVLDFGQNMTGWFAFRCREASGARVEISCGEILQDGNFYNENLRTAKEKFVYVSDGKERLVHPHFTFYGFRYLLVEGMGKPFPEDFEGWVIYSELEETGEIVTSDEGVNKLFENAKWGQKGNFLDVPTDCPQRDERMGWTGDAQIFAATASFNMYTPAFYHKYLYDMLLEQKKLGGSVPHVVPDILDRIMLVTGQEGEAQAGSCAWGDAACIIPWTLYLFYGDRELLRRHYPNMKLWVDYIRSVDDTHCLGSRLWQHGFHYADWLALDRPDAEDCVGGTDPFYVASAYYYYSAGLLAKAAGVLGLAEDESEYSRLAEEIREAVRKEYFTRDGSLRLTTQTACVLALYFGLAPEGARGKILESLQEKLEDRGMHLDTGFVGTPYLCPVLSENGRNDSAYTLLLKDDYPSWLYEVKMGATTVWERWNSVLPDGHISDTGMNSLNHYAYGSIVEWMYRCMCGLNPVPENPGFKEAVLLPRPDRRMEWVKMKYSSASGDYRCGWSISGDNVSFQVEVPFGAKAQFQLPPKLQLLTCNGVAVSCEQLELISGVYEITARFRQEPG